MPISWVLSVVGAEVVEVTVVEDVLNIDRMSGGGRYTDGMNDCGYTGTLNDNEFCGCKRKFLKGNGGGRLFSTQHTHGHYFGQNINIIMIGMNRWRIQIDICASLLWGGRRHRRSCGRRCSRRRRQCEHFAVPPFRRVAGTAIR
jgi:hypothetical protein